MSAKDFCINRMLNSMATILGGHYGYWWSGRSTYHWKNIKLRTSHLFQPPGSSTSIRLVIISSAQLLQDADLPKHQDESELPDISELWHYEAGFERMLN